MHEELVNIRLTRYFDVSVGLIDVNTVKRLQDAFVTEVDPVVDAYNMDEVFDSIKIRASNG